MSMGGWRPKGWAHRAYFAVTIGTSGGSFQVPFIAAALGP